MDLSFQEIKVVLMYMKRILLLLMCLFTLSCVSAQTVDGNKKKKSDSFKTIKTKSGKSVLPSYRSKKHLNFLKNKYETPKERIIQKNTAATTHGEKRQQRVTIHWVVAKQVDFLNSNYESKVLQMRITI